MGATVTAYRLAPAPRGAGLRSWDCGICRREELKRPVFLSGPDGLIAAGTGCAAVLLGYPQHRAARVRQDFDAVQAREDQRQELLAERREAYSLALGQFRARVEGEPAELARARKTYHQGGGSGVLGSFPAWIERVAATGDLS